MAMDVSASADIRQRAAHLAIRGRPAFEKQFFAAVFESDDPELVMKAMTMLMVSDRFHEGLPYINQSLDSPKVDVRKSGAIALTSYFRFCIAPSDPIPPDFYEALDKTLADTDARMRYIGVALIVFIDSAGRVLPSRYVPSVVEVIRKSDDRGQIAVAAAILEKLTKGEFRAGYPRDSTGQSDGAAAKKWLLENAPAAKLAALRWADANATVPMESASGENSGDAKDRNGAPSD
jgi:hypothetical protein